MPARTRKLAAPMGILCLGLLLGCLGRSPSTSHYSMRPVPGSAVGGSSDMAVGLGPIDVPRYLQRPQMVTRLDGSELKFDEFERWAGGFEANVTSVLADDLSTRLGGAHVVLDPSNTALPLAFRVSVTFQEFVGRPGESLVMRALWVIRSDGGDIAFSDETRVDEPLGRGPEALVSAHDAALGRLADAIAAGLVRAGASSS